MRELPNRSPASAAANAEAFRARQHLRNQQRAERDRNLARCNASLFTPAGADALAGCAVTAASCGCLGDVVCTHCEAQLFVPEGLPIQGQRDKKRPCVRNTAER